MMENVILRATEEENGREISEKEMSNYCLAYQGQYYVDHGIPPTDNDGENVVLVKGSDGQSYEIEFESGMPLDTALKILDALDKMNIIEGYAFFVNVNKR